MPEFTASQRLFHRQLRRFGAFVAYDDLDTSTSHVEFEDADDLADDTLRVTTAQLVPADQVEADA
jgi:hypothetical protein